MSKTEMLEYIEESLREADENTLEHIYWFLLENEEWKEVIQISNTEQGGMTRKRKIEIIAAALDNMTADVLDLIYRIVFAAESGIE